MRDIVVERLPQHKHCAECGNAILPGEKYCSDECEEKHTTRVQSRKRQLLLLYLGSLAAFVILILLSLWRV